VSGGAAAIFSTTGFGHALYERSSATQDVRVTRKVASLDGSDIGILLRYTDENNYIMLATNVGQLLNIYQKVAGSVTAITLTGSADMGSTSWLRLRMAVSGSTVTAYDGVDSVIATGTTTLLTGTKAGFFVSNYGRIDAIDIR
jgi:hypothetical protein